MIRIKFIPTGLEFEVEKKYADELLRDEPENFESVDGYKPEEPKAEPTIYESIVVEPKKEEIKETEEEIIPKRKRSRV